MIVDDIDRRPFRGAGAVDVVLPAGAGADLAGLRALLVEERAELAAELGAAVRFRSPVAAATPASPALEDRSRLLVGPAKANVELRAWHEHRGRPAAGVARVELDGGVVVVDGPDAAAAVDAVSLLRTAVQEGRALLDRRDAADADVAIERVVREVAWTYPSFHLRGIDWADVVARNRPVAERDGAAPATLQRWVAELRDPHTQVRTTRTRSVLPYTARADSGGVRLGHVPRWSAAWAAGIRAGDEVLAVGDGLDVSALLATSAGERRTRPWFAGRRALSVPADESTMPVELTVRRGERILRWQEPARSSPAPVSWSRLPSGTAYLRIRAWQDTPVWADAIDAAFADLAGAPRLIVDVRGNVGGNLMAATGFRRRFLTRRTRLGTVRFSTGAGTLAVPEPVVAEPADGVARWHRPVRFLVDRLCYSATEDAMFGLRGLPHVELWGEPTGGGSGRPRSVALQPGVVLHVSTALTFEPDGRCVEGNGLAVDVGLRPDVLGRGAAVRAADAAW